VKRYTPKNEDKKITQNGSNFERRMETQKENHSGGRIERPVNSFALNSQKNEERKNREKNRT